jgi:hypothetical protein
MPMADMRDRLEREGERVGLSPEVLEHIYSGRRRREVRRRVTAGIAGAAITIAVFVWLAGALSHSDSQPRPASTPSPTSIAGTYRMTLPASDPQVTELDVSGTYTLTLQPNDVIQLDAPPGFEQTHESASGDAYRVTGNIVTIGSFATFSCPGTVGTYRIDRTATALRLTPIAESCALREVIFGSRPWKII